MTSKKVYSRRPWYAPPIDPIEIIKDPIEQYNTGIININTSHNIKIVVTSLPFSSRHVTLLSYLYAVQFIELDLEIKKKKKCHYFFPIFFFYNFVRS